MALKPNRVAFTNKLPRSLVAGTLQYCRDHNLVVASFVEAALVHELGERLKRKAETSESV